MIIGAVIQRHNFLRIQPEPVFLQRKVDPGNPFHFSMAHRNLGIAVAIYLDTISTHVLGHITGGVRIPQQFDQVWRGSGNRDKTNTDIDAKNLSFPGELKVLHGLLQVANRYQRLLLRAGLQQYSELVPTQSGQAIVVSHGAL